MKNAVTVIEPSVSENVTGFIQFRQLNKEKPVHMHFQLKGFQPYQECAIHIHEFGDLRDGCKSLGGHFNPTGKQHGHHAGDLFYNLKANKNGNFFYDFLTDEISIFTTEKTSVIGRSVVIHSFTDDLGKQGRLIKNEFKLYKDMNEKELRYYMRAANEKFTNREDAIQYLNKMSKKTGNAGGRMACGVIGIC
jgi:Cu-Zn family superoxide dismutase